jgi:hypothetical protein
MLTPSDSIAQTQLEAPRDEGGHVHVKPGVTQFVASRTRTDPLPLFRGTIVSTWKTRAGELIGDISIWCPHCRAFHLHTWGMAETKPEHRGCHCTTPNSPYLERGYLIAPFRICDIRAFSLGHIGAQQKFPEVQGKFPANVGNAAAAWKSKETQKRRAEIKRSGVPEPETAGAV